MSKLVKEVNLTHHDDLYQRLVDLHEGCSPEKSQKINAKLILTMMNQIGDPAVLNEIFDLVKQSTEKWDNAA